MNLWKHDDDVAWFEHHDRVESHEKGTRHEVGDAALSQYQW